MKYLAIIGDGMADLSIAELNGKTPLEYLAPPGMAKLAGGEVGRARTCPPELPPGSDVAFLSIFGHDPMLGYTGRSPLEAAGCGVKLRQGDVSFRMNLVAISSEGYKSARMLSHNGGGIPGDEAYALVTALMKDAAFAAKLNEINMTITPSRSFRHIAVMGGVVGDGASLPFEMVPPHDIVGALISDHLPRGRNQEALCALTARAFEILSAHPINLTRINNGELAANAIWFWGDGTAAKLANFKTQLGFGGPVISAVPLVKGIARLSGLEAPDLPGATGLLDTDYNGKLDCALSALAGGADFAAIHVEAPDELSHDGDLEGKLEAIRRIDARIIVPLLERLPRIDRDYRVMLLPDHYTLLSTRTHDGTPVPYCVYDSRANTRPRLFTEKLAQEYPLIEEGYRLLTRLFAG